MRRAVLIVGAAAALVAVSTAALSAFLLRARTITLIDNGAAQQHETHALTVGQALSALGVPFGPRDIVSPPADTPLNDGDIVRIDRPRPVRLVLNGAETTLSTARSLPLDILAENGVALAPDDVLRVNGALLTPDELARWTAPVVEEIRIERRLPFSVRLTDPAAPQDVISYHASSAATIGEALFEAGFTLYLADIVEPALDSPLTSGTAILVQRALAVTLVLDGTRLPIRTRGQTVADALVDADVVLFGQDYARPPLSAPLQPGMTIEVVRVKEVLETEVLTAAPNTVYTSDPSLPAGSSESIRAGREGAEIIVTRVRYENGMEAGRTEVRRIRIAPLDELIGVGADTP
jgi:uncharacterized protein YabE (DUF348 family)